MVIDQIPAEVLRALLLNIEGEISAASPYAFLLDDDAGAELEPHLEWLAEHDLLESPADKDGRVAGAPALRRALDILARPVRRILISELGEDGMRRAIHVSDGAQAVVAMFDEHNCIVSDPLDLENLRDAVIENIGPSKKSGAVPDPLQFHPSVLGFLGAVAGPWWNEDDEGADGAGPDAPEYPKLSWPIDRPEAESRLTSLTRDAEFAVEILDALVADRILKAFNGKLDIHPSFESWHEALSSGEFIEIQRLEFPDSDLRQLQSPIRAFFAGPQGNRVLFWPAEEPSGEILLSKPSTEELESVVGYMVGYVELGEES